MLNRVYISHIHNFLKQITERACYMSANCTNIHRVMLIKY